MNSQTIGLALSAKRQKLRIDKGQAADRIGMSRTTYSSYEQDRQRPSVDVFPALAEFLGVGMEDFLLLYGATAIVAVRPALERVLVAQAVRKVDVRRDDVDAVEPSDFEQFTPEAMVEFQNQGLHSVPDLEEDDFDLSELTDIDEATPEVTPELETQLLHSVPNPTQAPQHSGATRDYVAFEAPGKMKSKSKKKKKKKGGGK
jgi:transcriptional regulator with XRE-family HTH domain